MIKPWMFKPYRNLPSTEHLVGYWPLDETSGTNAPDLSGNGNDGTLVNMEDADWVDGVVGKCLDFDGVDEKVSADGVISDVDLTTTGNATMCGWFKRTAASGRSFQGFGTDGNWGNYFFIEFDDDLVAVLLKGAVGSKPRATYNVGYSGSWVFICGVKTGEEIELFVNGVSAAADTTSGLGGNIVVTDFDIGHGYSSTYAFNGLIDEVRIYSTALTASEIKALYDYPAGV